MSTRFLEREADGDTQVTLLARDTRTGLAPVMVDSDDDLLKYYDRTNSAVRTVVNTAGAQTLTDKTLTSPTLTTPTVTSPAITDPSGSGFMITKRVTLTENGAGTSYTGTIAVPAGAVIEDIQVIPRVLWNGTSASLVVGDTADPNGYFLAIDLKATDAVVGEMFSVKHADMWGGEEGAYLVAATGQRGPVADNFGMSYVAGSNITFVVTPGAADGSAGRTDCVVIYSVPETVAQVAV